MLLGAAAVCCFVIFFSVHFFSEFGGLFCLLCVHKYKLNGTLHAYVEFLDLFLNDFAL